MRVATHLLAEVLQPAICPRNVRLPGADVTRSGEGDYDEVSSSRSKPSLSARRLRETARVLRNFLLSFGSQFLKLIKAIEMFAAYESIVVASIKYCRKRHTASSGASRYLVKVSDIFTKIGMVRADAP